MEITNHINGSWGVVRVCVGKEGEGEREGGGKVVTVCVGKEREGRGREGVWGRREREEGGKVCGEGERGKREGRCVGKEGEGEREGVEKRVCVTLQVPSTVGASN